MTRWQPQDHYFNRAKKEGFRARSVYKLEEVDRRVRLLRPGQRVLDLGCHPGSWLQYCARVVGKRGLVVGVDIRKITLELPPHVKVIQVDVFELSPADLHHFSKEFDVVLSDLAPATTGIRSVDSDRSFLLFQRAVALADDLLLPGSHFLGKIFQGSGYDEIVKELKGKYRKVRGIKPRATRKQSKEIFLLAMDKKA
ncbi:MAG: RlmE family RNA methyltransferase [Deltaproteobacteria bacterium]|nr:MAG: RlmE family RNA methyltransferase [Deltaproteobacteria bacterium]